MSDTARARLEDEAEELFPEDELDPETVLHCRAAHVRAKTVSDKQISKSAKAMFEHDRDVFDSWASITRFKDLSERSTYEYLESIRAAFSAAGFLVEGADDE